MQPCERMKEKRPRSRLTGLSEGCFWYDSTLFLGADLFYVSRLSEQIQFGATACESHDCCFLPHRLQSQFKWTFVMQREKDFIFQNLLRNSSPTVSQIHWKFREHSIDFRVLYPKYGLLKPTPPASIPGTPSLSCMYKAEKRSCASFWKNEI